MTLIDVSGRKGVERMTEKGIVANGVEYEVDCVIFASGFEVSTELSRRCGIDAIEGRDGLSLYDHWRDGYKTLHGMTTHGFPNQFFTGFTQGGVSANITAMFEQQANHIAYIIARPQTRRDDGRAEPGRPRTSGSRSFGRPPIDNTAFERAARPATTTTRVAAVGRATGRSSATSTRRASTPSSDLLAAWRDKGDLDGLELGR